MKCLLLKLTIVFALMLPVACQCNRHIDAMLESADKIVCAYPDSALTLLHAADTVGISDEQRAYYYLLETKASDKAYLEPQDIAPIDYATRVFKGRNDSVEAQALYYRGLVQYNNSDYGRALVSLMQAHEIADNCGDLFYKAMSSRSISDVYNMVMAYDAAAKSDSIAIEEFFAAGRPLYAKYQKVALPHYLIRSGRIDDAVKILDENAQDEFFLQPPICLSWYYCTRALSEFYTGNYQKALDWYNLAADEAPSVSANDWSRMAFCCINLGDGLKAEEYLDSARIHIVLDTDSAFIILVEADLIALKGDYKKAYQIESQYYKHESERAGYLLTHPYTIVLSEYLASEASKNLQNYKLARYKLWLWFFIAIISVIFAIMVYVLHIRKVRIDNAEKEILISDIRRLKREIKEIGDETMRLDKGIFDSSFINFVDDLLTIDSQSPDSEEGNRYLRKTFKTALDRVKAKDSLEQIDKFVSYYYGDIVQRLKSQIDSLTTKQIDYFLFKAAGFSNTSICQLLELNNINALHQLKSRLKNKIKGSGCPDRDDFLEILDSKRNSRPKQSL
ncbi:MAG: hypothetical protein K2M54_03065 [Muribaculaceae bacterium]|nr:hypothetical protein [Muribaculaceae bacterium]